MRTCPGGTQKPPQALRSTHLHLWTAELITCTVVENWLPLHPAYHRANWRAFFERTPRSVELYLVYLRMHALNVARSAVEGSRGAESSAASGLGGRGARRAGLGAEPQSRVESATRCQAEDDRMAVRCNQAEEDRMAIRCNQAEEDRMAIRCNQEEKNRMAIRCNQAEEDRMAIRCNQARTGDRCTAASRRARPRRRSRPRAWRGGRSPVNTLGQKALGMHSDLFRWHSDCTRMALGSPPDRHPTCLSSGRKLASVRGVRRRLGSRRISHGHAVRLSGSVTKRNSVRGVVLTP